MAAELVMQIEKAVLASLASNGPIGDAGITRTKNQKFYLLDDVVMPAKSMLEPAEIALLYVLARDYYAGGYLVDAGCLFGVSTAALAAGLRQSVIRPSKPKPIQSFDLFEFNPPYDQFAPGEYQQGPTSSAFEMFLQFNARNLDLVAPHQGEFLKWNWKEAHEIDLIFNDLSKTLALNNRIFNQYVTQLKPGVGFLVQQDYVHFAEWWVAASMEYLAEDFEEFGYFFGATKLFRLKSGGCPRAAEFDLRDLSFDTIERLLTSAIERAPITVKEALTTALGMFYIDADRPDRALQTVLPMKLDAEIMERLINADVPAHRNFATILPSNRRRVIEYARSGSKTLNSELFTAAAGAKD